LIDSNIAGVIVPCDAPGAPNDARNQVLWRLSRKLPYRVRVVDDQNRRA